jgi:Pyruvate/2-oxoacid:ferredoxin oxidoreductase delta subunit
MKPVQLFGFGLFLTALTVFLFVPVISEFKITESVMHEVLDQERAERVVAHPEFKAVSKDTLSNSFELSTQLRCLLKSVNEDIRSEAGITEAMKSALLSASFVEGENRFGQSLIEEWIPEDRSRAREMLWETTEWISSREYDSREALANDLEPKIAEANVRITEELGFADNFIKDLKFQVAREAHVGYVVEYQHLLFWVCFVVSMFAALLMIVPEIRKGPPGIRNDHLFFKSMTSRGAAGVALGILLIVFYVLLYWWPEHIAGLVVLLNPLSQWIKGAPASQWFLYGLLYTFAILVMGVRMFIRYRNNKYQRTRTISVMFFQLFFAFLIPEILLRLNQPYMDLKNIWPLDYDLFFNGQLLDYSAYQSGETAFIGGKTAMYFLFWGIALAVIGVPVITYFYGKRWYCSWVCGCGGLAETAGDPFRHLSDKSLRSWQVERWMVHGVLVFAVVMTALTLYTFFSGSWSVWGISTGTMQKTYGFLIGAAFAGVVGTGFYPLMGNRVWCRFGCPLAAYLGLVQRFKSRFRITTNGGQCISCGNCSTYCEMGIDVRWYAQRGQNIVRSSCVGCGICAAVCPRGVLKLENGPEEGRINDNPILIGRDGVHLSPEVTGNA